MGETEVLARYVANAQYEDLPAEVVAHTKKIVMDIIACGLGGRKTPEGDALIDIAKEDGLQTAGDDNWRRCQSLPRASRAGESGDNQYARL